MAITKLGKDLKIVAKLMSIPIGLSAIVSAISGGYRADSLLSDEKRKIKEYYELDDNTSLPLRNAAKGALGGAIGTTLGIIPAIGGSKLSLKGFENEMSGKGFVRGRLLRNIGTLLTAIPPVVGGGIGTYYTTNKYSKNSDALK